MKHLLFAASLGVSTTCASFAQTVIAVDYGLSGSSIGGAETNFTSATRTSSSSGQAASETVTVNGVQATLFGNGTAMGARERSSAIADSGSFTYGDLLQDGFTNIARTSAPGTTTSEKNTNALTASPTTNTLSISGLAASTSYVIRIWAVDTRTASGSPVGSTWSWYDTTNGFASATLIGTLVQPNTATANNAAFLATLTNNNVYSVSATVTSTAGGVLNFGLVNGDSSGFINGFELSAIPEPASAAALFGLAAVGAFATRRRRGAA